MNEPIKDPWWCWVTGRQKSGYEKMILFINERFIPFDFYILKYLKGSFAPVHTDYVPGYRHYRFNLILHQAKEGGVFDCRHPIISTRWLYFFRSDRAHSVSKIKKGSRYVFSVGICIPRRSGRKVL